MTILLPFDRLPAERHARHGRLRDYFCDKDATSTLADGIWHLDLDWPGEAERHVDPRIAAELPSWGEIGLGGMAMAHRRSARVLTALYDTWTLPSWSEWAARAAPAADTPITILHLDDHRDLGSPRLAAFNGGLRDLITGDLFDIREPSTVLAACVSGAVGMGSFLTPFLIAFPNCDVRQLGQAPKITATTDYTVAPATVKDDLLQPGVARPAIRLEPAADGGAGPGRYRATADLGDWLDGIGSGPVLLHVDMDYFNNRYDGDGDWPDRVRRHDPPLDDVLLRIDEVTGAMRSAGLLERIEDAVVAFSPGFFPAEMWQASELRLREGLEELYG
ncbi:hypothetical protein [Sphingomonas sp. NPDC079357]|uniref:hypothetical protein n=1 Tax=Sphingomonas sp. NPDC079357 TaxID=3364518 RepID=UPI00384AE82F